jgi:hypothetical protein
MYRFNEPWDSPANRRLLELMPDVYKCDKNEAGLGLTSYVALVADDHKDGASSNAEEGSRIVGVIESVVSKVPWTEPTDMAVCDIARIETNVFVHSAGVLVALNPHDIYVADEAGLKVLSTELGCAD